MENLYERISKTQETLDDYKYGVVFEDFEDYFIEQYIPQLIESVLSSLNIGNALNYDSISDIPVNKSFEVCVDDLLGAKICDGNIFIEKSSKLAFKQMIIQFLNDNGIDFECINNEIILHTTLKQIIDAYYLELQRRGKFANFENKTDYYSKASTALLGLQSVYVDNVHEYFEQEFLDNAICKLIKDVMRDSIDLNNYENIDSNKISACKTLLFKKKSLEDKEGESKYTYYIDDKFFDDFAKLVTDFRDFYENTGIDLGRVDLYVGGSTINFWISTTLAKLMDVYYMEKQRIAHYTSGDYLVKAADPKAWRLILKNSTLY